MPSTWQAYATDIFGYVPPLTPANEHIVVEGKIRAWLSEGLPPRDIFLIWNQGHNGPCISGVNEHHVRYDSCEYVEDALRLLSQAYETSPQ